MIAVISLGVLLFEQRSRKQPKIRFHKINPTQPYLPYTHNHKPQVGPGHNGQGLHDLSQVARFPTGPPTTELSTGETQNGSYRLLRRNSYFKTNLSLSV
jgi:hypothetical protein